MLLPKCFEWWDDCVQICGWISKKIAGGGSFLIQKYRSSFLLLQTVILVTNFGEKKSTQKIRNQISANFKLPSQRKFSKGLGSGHPNHDCPVSHFSFLKYPFLTQPHLSFKYVFGECFCFGFLRVDCLVRWLPGDAIVSHYFRSVVFCDRWDCVSWWQGSWQNLHRVAGGAEGGAA